jgi:hypothetical protein
LKILLERVSLIIFFLPFFLHRLQVSFFPQRLELNPSPILGQPVTHSVSVVNRSTIAAGFTLPEYVSLLTSLQALVELRRCKAEEKVEEVAVVKEGEGESESERLKSWECTFPSPSS